MFILTQFPTNTALRKIAQQRMLEMVDLTPEELKQVEDAEEQQVMEGSQQGLQDLGSRLEELSSLTA